ncbi:cytochrome P450 [Streptomyces phyllanthi]|uniref:Cytochrome P450 n=1 Tax=Streptomyces phyllanthi TaxID=1803180 RepID=A0A5N8W1H3_9ACTN|nr:cytochrome P450 [Streptomyces phyllanthi]MPY40952.1 cytochrome P450 [Streptomyces phyllanthi]
MNSSDGIAEARQLPGPSPVPVPVPDAPGRLPVLGHLVQLGRRPLDFFQSLRAQGPVVRIGFGPKPAYVVNDPDLIRRVFVNDASDYDKGVFWEKVREFVGDGLASVSSGEFHLQQRRQMQPAFHRKQIARYAEIMSACLTERAESWQPGQAVSMDDEMQQTALTLVARTFFSSHLGQEAAHALEESFPTVQDGIIKRTLAPLGLMEKLPTPANRRFTAAMRNIWESCERAVDDYRATGADGGDLMSMLIHATDPDTGDSMSDRLIRDQVITIALSGRDTTANALAWTMYQLSRRPDVADRVAAEVRATIGDRPANLDDLMALDYTGRVAKEVFRLYAFWLLIRSTVKDVTLGGVPIPANTQVLVSPIAMHRDPSIYEDPLSLDPDRWLPGRAEKIPRNAYFVFGAGNRQCIGDRYAWTAVMLGLAAIAPRWELRPVPGTEVTEVAKVSVSPSGLPLRVVPRAMP